MGRSVAGKPSGGKRGFPRLQHPWDPPINWGYSPNEPEPVPRRIDGGWWFSNVSDQVRGIISRRAQEGEIGYFTLR